MRKITDNMYAVTDSSEREWLEERNQNWFRSEEQCNEYRAYYKERREKAIAAEKKEKRENTIIAIVLLVVIILIIWGILAWIAHSSGGSIGSILFALFFFPAIFMAAKGS